MRYIKSAHTKNAAAAAAYDARGAPSRKYIMFVVFMFCICHRIRGA